MLSKLTEPLFASIVGSIFNGIATGVPVALEWILATSFWSDTGVWIDSSSWSD